ncbi:hypothetical protein [Myxococcus llanfairpwllgwyngyllgogerychwyrndrobwllllantysiliogogogochensis]|nr:hypothetical protein [Myxococcus llanfairpwllgwyngyllgogerychwyrndrobwllllantysiliogogogochensis]
MPTNSEVAWSTAMKPAAWSSRVVTMQVALVTYMASGMSVVIVPSW